MYNYTPIGIYSSKALLDEGKQVDKMFLDSEDLFVINTTELNTVKTLFQIRNANHYRKKITIKELKNPISNFYLKERIFIAGKIFPVLNLIYKNYIETLDARKVELRNWNQRGSFYNPKVHNKQYVSIDNDNLMILLPISYSGINFPELMLDFLTNGTKTKHTIGGEFPDYPTYKLALREKAIDINKWKGEDGCWLTHDRTYNGIRWWNGYIYVVKNKALGRLAPFKQIYDFYNVVDSWIGRLGHEVKWCKGAKKLVEALSRSPIYIGGLETGSDVIDDDVETILNELNLGICDYAIGKFHELIYGKYSTAPLKGNNAYKWDVEFITHEQGIIAPPIYNKTSSNTIKKYQKMADKDPANVSHTGIISSLGLGSLLLNDVTPAFDDFKPAAKVTDHQFRIDLPLLMLYLDKHTPKWTGFTGKLNNDGTVNSEIKKIINLDMQIKIPV